MKILLEESGFCFGVKRAFLLAKKNFGQSFQTLGPLIHNNEVLKEIEQNGGQICQKVSEVENNKNLIIRAHGISQKKFLKLQKKTNLLQDATCPFVIKLQNEARNFYKNNFFLIIVGQKNHPEIKAICEDCPKAKVIFSEKEAEEIPKQEKIALVAQTTEREEKFNSIAKILKTKSKILKISNTICLYVKKRQKAAQNLSLKVDLLLVIGGKKSSNTKKLFEIGKQNCLTFLIQNKTEIPWKIIKSIKPQKIGLCSGTSTHEKTIKSIKLALENY